MMCVFVRSARGDGWSRCLSRQSERVFDVAYRNHSFAACSSYRYRRTEAIDGNEYSASFVVPSSTGFASTQPVHLCDKYG